MLPAWYGLREGTLQADKFTPGQVPQNRKPRESPLRASRRGNERRFRPRFLSGAKHLYQSVLNTLAAPTLVVLHFPIHAFQAEKSFQLAWACLK